MEVLDGTEQVSQPASRATSSRPGLLNSDMPLIRYRIGDRDRPG